MRSLIVRRCADRLSRRAAVRHLAGASAAIAASAGGLSIDRGAVMATATAKETSLMSNTLPATDPTALTIMLVHGAFADASGWSGVVDRLQGQGYTVIAPPNPLRGVAHDAAYIASLLGQTAGPVLLVGHSYGGVVISNAAANADNVVGLVFVAALAPDAGESLLGIEGDSRDSILASALLPLQYPASPDGQTAVEFIIQPDRFHEAFAADLPLEQTKVMAATQRPAAEAAFAEVSGVPAWKALPSWAVLPTGDKAAGSDVLRFLAKRAGATVTEVEGSHAIMISQPEAVANVILTAAAAVS